MVRRFAGAVYLAVEFVVVVEALEASEAAGAIAGAAVGEGGACRV